MVIFKPKKGVFAQTPVTRKLKKPMSTKKSQINLLNHSEAKVKLFGDYIQKYLNIICNDGYTKAIHIIDLFCGPGIYENGGEGSPIIALKKVKMK